jgi:fatty acid desaturase
MMKSGVERTADAQERAREKAMVRYAFRWHAVVYTGVNLLLVGIWYITGQGFPWFVFPLGGWGIGLVAHYGEAYGNWGRDWTERETERILQEEQRR